MEKYDKYRQQLQDQLQKSKTDFNDEKEKFQAKIKDLEDQLTSSKGEVENALKIHKSNQAI